MADAARAETRNTIFINAPPDTLYRAFTDPAALAVWRAPGDMTGQVHRFDYRVGGGYTMSLYYPASGEAGRGKTADREDRYTARFVELAPPARIVEAITFDSTDPAFAGEMIMDVTLEAADGGTTVAIVFKHIPPGIRPEDNELGTRSALEKLARYIERETNPATPDRAAPPPPPPQHDSPCPRREGARGLGRAVTQIRSKMAHASS